MHGCLCVQGLEDESMKSAAIDIFSYIVEFSPSMVREYVLNEAQKQDDVSGLPSPLISYAFALIVW